MSALAHTRTKALVAVCLFVLCTWIFTQIFERHPLRIEPLSVGKGTAYLVRAPNGAVLLVNTGSDASILRALGTRLPPWQRTIAVVLLTDPGPNTAGGLPSVLARYHVTFLVRSAARGAASREQAIESALANQKRLRSLTAERGLRVTFGGVPVDILWPNNQADRGAGLNTTVAARITYGSTSFLLDEGLPERAKNWLTQIEHGVLAGAVLLSSSTPPLVSNGVRIIPD